MPKTKLLYIYHSKSHLLFLMIELEKAIDELSTYLVSCSVGIGPRPRLVCVGGLSIVGSSSQGNPISSSIHIRPPENWLANTMRLVLLSFPLLEPVSQFLVHNQVEVLSHLIFS